MERGVSVLSTRNADLPRKTPVGSIIKSSNNGNGKDDQSVFKQGMLVFVHHDVDIWTEGTVSGIDGENILVTLPSGKEQWVKHKDIALRNECDYASTEDLTLLTPLTCASVFQCLKKRYQQDVFYTRAGVTLVAINPFKDVPSLYKKEVIDRYHQLHGQRKVLSPHVFAIAQEAYSHMRQQVGRMNQSVIVSGESGSGKTVTAKHLMKYLTSISNSNAGDTGTRIESRILDSNPILEAFGNASTSRNSNSSRFGKYIQLQFQRNGQILGASIQTYLLEKTRVVHQAENERNFHIFYQMLNGGNDVEKEEWLGRKDSLFKMITNHGACTEDQQSWRQTREAMGDIGITAQQQDSIFKVLGAILHLGNLVFDGDGDQGCYVDTDDQDCNVSLDLASKLLGVDPSVLEKALTFRRIAASHSRRQSVFHKPCNEQEGRSRRDCLSKTLYSRLFDWLVSFINGCIKTKELYSFIGLLDIYGFESFINNSLEQLCINYANERLQQHFVAHFLKELQAEYVKEALPWTHTDFVDNRPCVELLDGSLGIFSLLIEECNLNRPSSVKMICDRIFTSARSHRHFQQPKKDLENPWFAVKHYAGTVQYQVSGLVDKNKDNVPAELVDMLKNSDNGFIASLFADFETDQPGKKKKTVLAKFKSSLDALMKTLNSTECLYIRCIKPNQHCEAGHFDGQYVITQLEACGVMETVEISRNGYPARIPYDKFVQKFGIIIKSEPTHPVSLSSQSESDRDAEKENDLLFDPLDKLFKKQLSLLDTPKKSGTPKKKLRRRTGLSSSDHTRKCCASVMKIVFGFQPNLSKQFGRTKLFLQDGQLEQLEAARCKLLSRYAFTIQCAWRRYKCKKRKSILKIQAVMRGWLVRRKWQKTLDAVRTIQAAWKLCKAKRVQAMCSQTGAITDIEKTSPKTPEEQMVSQNTNNVHSYSVREWRPCDKDVRHENMLPSPRLVKSLQDLSLSVGLPRLSHVETQDGIVSFRRMPRVHIKFHTKPNKVLKYAHFISQKEFLCSLTDCLPQYDPV